MGCPLLVHTHMNTQLVITLKVIDRGKNKSTCKVKSKGFYLKTLTLNVEQRLSVFNRMLVFITKTNNLKHDH